MVEESVTMKIDKQKLTDLKDREGKKLSKWAETQGDDIKKNPLRYIFLESQKERREREWGSKNIQRNNDWNFPAFVKGIYL